MIFKYKVILGILFKLCFGLNFVLSFNVKVNELEYIWLFENVLYKFFKW